MVANIESAKARYGALCILQIGAYSAPPLTTAWLANNTPAPGKRTLILGLNGWGNLAGVIGSVSVGVAHPAPSWFDGCSPLCFSATLPTRVLSKVPPPLPRLPRYQHLLYRRLLLLQVPAHLR
jgi:hypothetical protein